MHTKEERDPKARVCSTSLSAYLCVSAEESKLAWPVGGHNHLDLPQVLEAVQLVEQLHQRALDLPVCRTKKKRRGVCV